MLKQVAPDEIGNVEQAIRDQSAMLEPKPADNAFAGSMFAIGIGAVASAFVAPVAAAGIALAADVAMQNRTTSFATQTGGKKASKANSLFLGRHVQSQTISFRSQTVSLVPATPSKYNSGLFVEQIKRGRDSVTGRSQGNRNRYAPVGAKIDLAAAELKSNLDYLFRFKNDRYGHSTKLLYSDYMKGIDNAESYVEKNKVKVQTLFGEAPPPDLKKSAYKLSV